MPYKTHAAALSAVAFSVLALAAAHPASAALTLQNGDFTSDASYYNQYGGSSEVVPDFTGTVNYSYAYGIHSLSTGDGATDGPGMTFTESAYINGGAIY